MRITWTLPCGHEKVDELGTGFNVFDIIRGRVTCFVCMIVKQSRETR